MYAFPQKTVVVLFRYELDMGAHMVQVLSMQVREEEGAHSGQQHHRAEQRKREGPHPCMARWCARCVSQAPGALKCGNSRLLCS